MPNILLVLKMYFPMFCETVLSVYTVHIQYIQSKQDKYI